MRKRIVTIIIGIILLIVNSLTTYAANTHTYNSVYFEEWRIAVHVEIGNLENDYSRSLANQMVKVKTIIDADTSSYRDIKVELELANGVKITEAKAYIGIGWKSLKINDNMLTTYFNSAPSSRISDLLIYAEHTCAKSVDEVTGSTCYQEGSIVKKCISCGHVMQTSTIEKKNHNWSEWTVETASTCQSEGKEVRSCLNDGCVEEEEKPVSKSNNHNWSEWTVETSATCHSDGQEARSCLTTGCEERETNPIPKTNNHNWGEWTVDTSASCHSDGQEVRSCLTTGCEERETNPIPKTNNHNWSEWTVETTATCQSEGKEVRFCLNDGCVEEEENPILKSSTHNWGEWTVETLATCHSDGQEARSCLTTGCEERETNPILKTNNHNWSEWKNIYSDESGEISKEIRNCLDCKKEEAREINISKDETTNDEIISVNTKAPTTGDRTNVSIWFLITLFFAVILVLNEKILKYFNKKQTDIYL